MILFMNVKKNAIMNKIKAFICVAIIAILASSCQKLGTPVQPIGQKGDFKPEFLFEVDGIRVYRFYDGRTIYFTSATGQVEWTITESNGKIKTITHHEQTVCQKRNAQ